MGRAWCEASPAAAATMRTADTILAGRFPKPLSAICFEGPEELLNRTDVAQPAIYAVSVACFRAKFGEGAGSGNGTARDEARGSEVRIAAAAGLSLGEYTALHLAGCFSFEDGLELVALRGKAMQDAAVAVPSGMVALIGADRAQAEAVCEAVLGTKEARNAAGEVLVPANFNAPGQVVLSGTASACDRAVEAAGKLGLRASKLAVAGAFHSPLMAPAGEKLRVALERTPIREPRCVVMSNVLGRAYGGEAGSRIGDGVQRIRELLVEQLTSPVLWSDDCAWLVENVKGEFHELAPGKVLTGLMRRISRETKVVNHDVPS